MPIRPIDLQTMIPKLPEVQKAKSAENENYKNNININIHKDQEKNERNTKQVVAAKEAMNSKINREGKDKGRQDKRERKQDDSGDETEELEKGKQISRKNTRIDIRI